MSSTLKNGMTTSEPPAHSHQHESMPQGATLPIFIIFSFFLLIGWFAKKTRPGFLSARLDLLQSPFVENIVRSKYFSFGLRIIPAIIFVVIVLSGLLGRDRSSLAAPFTWLVWWTLLIVFVAFGGKIFCAACPWDFFANLFQFNGLFGGKNKGTTLGIKWPKWLANIYLSVFIFIVITWLELAVGVVYSSYATALMGLAVVTTAILFALIFRKRAFCRYVCPVGRISGIYAQFSPLELRVRDPKVCQDCRSKACVRGTQYTSPCPTELVPFRLQQSTYCTLCTECIRSCPDRNLTLKLRPPAVDLYNQGLERKDEVTLAIVILILTFFHGFTMIPHWARWTGWLEQQLGFIPLAASSSIMIVALAISFGLYKAFCNLLDQRLGLSGLNEKFIYAFIPLVLGYHVGHNAMHFLGEGAYVLPLLNDPLGRGWNLFGLRDYFPTALVGHGLLVWIQLLFVAIGFYFSVRLLKFKVQTLLTSKAQRWMVFGWQYSLLTFFGVLGVWFIFQPMAMRGNY